MFTLIVKDKIGTVHEYLTYLFFFLIPMPNSLLPLALGLWVASWLVWRLIFWKERFPLKNTSTKIGVSFFLLFNLYNYASAFWGFDPPSGGSIMEHRLAFLLLSIVLLFGLYPKLVVNKLIKAYFLGNLAVIFFFTLQFIYTYIFDGVFKYQLDIVGLNASIDVFKHPAYISLNLVLSFFLFLTTLKNRKGDVLFSVISFILIASFVFFSRSRAGVFNLILLSFGIVFYLSRKSLGVKNTLLIAIPLVIVFGYGISHTSKFENIFDTSEHVVVRAPRKLLWKSAVELAIEKPLFGYGIGSSKQVFIQKCENNGMYYAESVKYNVHNQFLEFLLESGLVGLLLLFFSLYYFLQGIDKQQRWKGVSLLLIFAVALSFESMLLRIAGISSFVAILLYLAVSSCEQQIVKTKVSVVEKSLIGVTMVLFIIVLLLTWESSKLGFNPAFPSTYAYKDYVLVEPQDLPRPLPAELTGNEIAGAKYDATSTASTWSGNAYLVNTISDQQLNEDEKLEFSTYCYVSSDFDGDWVRISIELDGEVPFAQDYYNFKNKGVWQKLEVVVDNNIGPMPAHFFFKRSNSSNFKDLKGYVLFAYPQYIISEK